MTDETMATSVSDHPRVGTTIAGYRIERLLGRGGMGTVYLAEDLALERKVALKVLPPELSDNEAFRERIRLESRRAASIDHPNVIPIYEAGQANDGTLFIAMRYVEGADLKQVLRREGALPPKRVVELLGQAAKGLDAAHARGLVHRDVKPSNVLVASSENGEEHVYLADFGLTQIASSPEMARESITLSGSSDYVSPEQIRGTESNGASDVYGLGCVAFECLTGSVPFPKTSEPEVLFAHMNDEPSRPSTVNPALPSALDAVTAKAMSKEPGERYATGSELVEAIRDATATKRIFGRGMLVAAAGFVAVIVAAAIAATVLLTGGGDGGSAPPDPDNSTITTIAGTGAEGFSGDGGPAMRARFSESYSIALDSGGNLYIADYGNFRIRKIDPDGVITTFAGTGNPGAAGDGGPAEAADLRSPDSLSFDAAGNLYFAEFSTGIVRKIDTGGVISTIAGGGRELAESGLATDASLIKPWINVGADGIVYIGDEGHHRILRVDPDGTYSQIAGTGGLGFSGDGGPATEAMLAQPTRLDIGLDGSVYFSDFGNLRIRRIDSDGVITTIAGTGVVGFSGDGGPATDAQIADPSYLVFDSKGNLYFSDSAFGSFGNRSDFGNRVRKIDTNGIITTVAGTGVAGFSGDGGPATEARFNYPTGLAFDADENLYILDSRNFRIRKVTFE